MRALAAARRRANWAELQSLFSRLIDVVLIAVGAAVAMLFRPAGEAHPLGDGSFVAISIASALLLFPLFHVYQSWRGRSKLMLVCRILLAWLVAQVCAGVVMFALHRTGFVSRLWVGWWTLNTGAALVVSRFIVHLIQSRMRHAGYDLRAVGVVGVGAHCENVVAKIAASPTSGFRMAVSFISQPTIQLDMPGMSVCRDLKAFAAAIRAKKVPEVWVALPMSEEQALRNVLEEFSGDLVNIRFIPDVRSLAMFDGEMVELMGAPAINLVAPPLSGPALLQKAIFDRMFAAFALILISPLVIAIAIAVKLSSHGPVFFRQTRKGADGKSFRIFKFRTMRSHVQKAGVIQQATRNDPRITPLGGFLRRTSLDELPQFLNVLRGEMSVVGPRPHATEHDDYYQKIVDGYIHRYRIKPGITGWAQVNGFRGETDRIEKMQGRVEYDMYYIRNWSLKLDIRIVIATFIKGLVHRNAY
ncbi:UDP-glucose:undecaprenyl-phosphate glucose-1-phosphate transferase [Caballeronia sp. SBC1]|uniref:undecaprenyl-phosphate glucose phosphotransferase n=1 Tax=unclassified Caballeronia TaxID=2646786 RepID=UPI0013E14337|nr:MULTISPECIES: undecaprenyl-phosphate glucose phosphotransferase [unclassified Caballeronia]QIE22010.1 UDP-glucose:undecaprenyl-phosphate glucose-1-phosphate transferase [Caballeronia sp. SBC2]QIN60045.1 UDP-glucose:undecaprenyl-phosphate glucose-1-phosphate transferase [Caballeronia sp. SBC1]